MDEHSHMNREQSHDGSSPMSALISRWKSYIMLAIAFGAISSRAMHEYGIRDWNSYTIVFTAIAVLIGMVILCRVWEDLGL